MSFTYELASGVEARQVAAGADAQLRKSVVTFAGDAGEFAADEDRGVVGRGLDRVDQRIGAGIELGNGGLRSRRS